MTVAQFFWGLVLMIFIFIAIAAGIHFVGYKTAMYANITTEELITYEVIKHRFSSVKMYPFKLSDISDRQYETFIKVLRIDEIVRNSSFRIWLGIALLGIILSAIGLLAACIIWYDN